MAITDEGNPSYLQKDMPLTSDMFSMLKKLGSGKQGEAVNDLVNIVAQGLTGVNPQTATDVALDIMDACGNDPELANEAAIFVMRAIQVPQSQIDKLYFDEINLSGEEASHYTPKQLAERYVRYKVKRGSFCLPWQWGDEASADKMEKKANKLIRECLSHIGDTKVNEAYLRYEDKFKKVDDVFKKARKAYRGQDEEKYYRYQRELPTDKTEQDFYGTFKEGNKNLDECVDKYTKATTPEETEEWYKKLADCKRQLVEQLDSLYNATK